MWQIREERFGRLVVELMTSTWGEDIDEIDIPAELDWIGVISQWGAVGGSRSLPRLRGSRSVQFAQIPKSSSCSEHTWKQHSRSSLLCNALAACSPVTGMFGSENSFFASNHILYQLAITFPLASLKTTCPVFFLLLLSFFPYMYESKIFRFDYVKFIYLFIYFVTNENLIIIRKNSMIVLNDIFHWTH